MSSTLPNSLGSNCEALCSSSKKPIPTQNHVEPGTKLVLGTISQQPIVKQSMLLLMIKTSIPQQTLLWIVYVHAAKWFMVELAKILAAAKDLLVKVCSNGSGLNFQNSNSSKTGSTFVVSRFCQEFQGPGPSLSETMLSCLALKECYEQ